MGEAGTQKTTQDHALDGLPRNSPGLSFPFPCGSGWRVASAPATSPASVPDQGHHSSPHPRADPQVHTLVTFAALVLGISGRIGPRNPLFAAGKSGAMHGIGREAREPQAGND